MGIFVLLFQSGNFTRLLIRFSILLELHIFVRIFQVCLLLRVMMRFDSDATHLYCGHTALGEYRVHSESTEFCTAVIVYPLYSGSAEQGVPVAELLALLDSSRPRHYAAADQTRPVPI